MLNGMPQVTVLPAPLLLNLGHVSLPCCKVDMHVPARFILLGLFSHCVRVQIMLVLDSQEHTVKEWIDLMEGTGWQLEDIKCVKCSTMCSLILGLSGPSKARGMDTDTVSDQEPGHTWHQVRCELLNHKCTLSQQSSQLYRVHTP
jgi:hypothetical protein